MVKIDYYSFDISHLLWPDPQPLDINQLAWSDPNSKQRRGFAASRWSDWAAQ